MQRATRRICYLALGIFVISLQGLSPLAAEEPTLARLSFWVPPEQMVEFEAMYEEQVVPILKQHGLTEFAQPERSAIDSVFSRLFKFRAPVEVSRKLTELWEDPTWRELRQNLGTAFGVGDPNGLVAFEFHLYRTPAGPGSTLKAGRGFRQDLWHTLGFKDGVHFGVRAILQDQVGHLWIGSAWSGISRYDGTHFTTFTTADGLVSDRVGSILEDGNGNLWVGTEWGLSRYDGRQMENFSRADGLGGNLISCLFEDGNGHLWAGTDGGASRYDGTEWITYTRADGLGGDQVNAVLEDRQGQLWFATESGVSRYDDTGWVTYTHKDGLGSDMVRSLAEDSRGVLWAGTDRGASYFASDRFVPAEELESETIWAIAADDQGQLWFGTSVNGVSRFDGNEWTEFTVTDGLAGDQVYTIVPDRQGQLWFGTITGLSRYDQGTMAHFTTANGLVSNGVLSILEDRHGNLWFGTLDGVSRYDGTIFTSLEPLAGWEVWAMVEDRHGNLWFGDGRRKGAMGAMRYDGTRFTRFTREDGLADDNVRSMFEDRQGRLWFGSRNEVGVSRFDGENWDYFTKSDGLGGTQVEKMLEDRHGNLWFATYGEGVSRFDGQSWVRFSEAEGLPNLYVKDILEDRHGNLWFSTFGGGISRYDGRIFTNFTMEDGLVYDLVLPILKDRRGQLWVGTYGGGISRYDGRLFQSLSRQDGLIFDAVHALLEDRNGDIWVGTEGGVTRYRSLQIPPEVQLQAVIADRRYEPDGDIQIPASQNLVVFEFQGSSLTTSPERMAYVCRLEGRDSEWMPVYVGRVEYEDLPTGEYTFQVKAVDRDLNYSEPARVQIAIRPPHAQWTLTVGLGLALVGLVMASGYALKKRREQRRAEQALMQELEDELQTARKLQMSLMPESTPDIPGLDVAGRCFPVNHVCGDFFQYFVENDSLSICMADVTGHAMEAAVPVMMFSGVLETEMRLAHPLDELFGHLNQTLHHKLDRRTYVCFTMGKLQIREPGTRSLQLTNGGCPYPYHYKAAGQEVAELQMDAYPLGIRPETEYQVIETQLNPGDCVVFCSDGIIEAGNAQEEIFGFERTSEAIRQGCREGQSAEELIDRLISAVKVFTGDTPQGDDMTVVVLKVDA